LKIKIKIRNKEIIELPRKKTHEEFLEEVKALVGNEYEVLGEYKNSNTKILFKHNECSHEYEATPSKFLNGRRCPKCSTNHKKTTEQYKNEVYNLVGDEYEVLGEYNGSNEKIEMKHSICGYEYDVQAGSFLSGSRCPKCSGLMKKNTEIFKQEVHELVGDEYEVIGKYINARTKISMKHNICGHEYNVSPNQFLNGIRCPKCFGDHKKTTENFKKDVYNLVSDEYEVLGEYINSKTKIKIKHKVCEYVYNVIPNNFLRGKRCPKCAGRCKTTESFKQEVYNLVGDEYVVLGEYTSALKKIKMRHNTCGFNYNARPNDFLSGKRCSKCNESKGEKIVRRVLEKQQILYKSQYKIKGCRNINSLPFDFAIFNDDATLNCLIEFDGKQHFEPVNHFGGEKGFKQRQHNDQIKNQYCKDNNIKLIRIPYWDFDNIEDILNEELKDLVNSEHYVEQAS